MTSKHATYSVTKRAKQFAPTPQEVSRAVASYCTVSGLYFDYDTDYDNLKRFSQCLITNVWVRSSHFWDVTLGRRLPTFQYNISVPQSGVKQSQENSSATIGPLRTGPTDLPTICNIQEDRRPQLHRRKSWKYRSYTGNSHAFKLIVITKSYY